MELSLMSADGGLGVDRFLCSPDSMDPLRGIFVLLETGSKDH